MANNLRAFLRSTAVCALMAASFPAYSQDNVAAVPEETESDEIIVTATRQSEGINKVPIRVRTH